MCFSILSPIVRLRPCFWSRRCKDIICTSFAETVRLETCRADGTSAIYEESMENGVKEGKKMRRNLHGTRIFSAESVEIFTESLQSS